MRGLKNWLDNTANISKAEFKKRERVKINIYKTGRLGRIPPSPPSEEGKRRKFEFHVMKRFSRLTFNFL